MSKKLLKVSSYISFATAAIYFFAFVLSNNYITYHYFIYDMEGYFFLLSLAIFSFFMTFSGILFLHYTNLDEEEYQKKNKVILIWSIILLFISNLSGIFALLAYLFINNEKESNRIDYIEELKELEKLLKKDIINSDEYNKKKKKLLNI